MAHLRHEFQGKLRVERLSRPYAWDAKLASARSHDLPTVWDTCIRLAGGFKASKSRASNLAYPRKVGTSRRTVPHADRRRERDVRESITAWCNGRRPQRSFQR